MANLVETFFLDDGEVNMSLTLPVESSAEAAQFLVNLIRHWIRRQRLFCLETGLERDETGEVVSELPEDTWEFTIGDGSNCPGCRKGKQIITKLFGENPWNFAELPFAQWNDGVITFQMKLLKLYAEHNWKGPMDWRKLVSSEA